MLPPSDQKYQGSDVLAKLPQMPRAEQPSPGWEWCCQKRSIDSLGLKVGGWREDDEGEDLGGQAIDEDNLYWGCPFWDKETLDFLMPTAAELKKAELKKEAKKEAEKALLNSRFWEEEGSYF
jgi:hypothetical protein